MKKILVIMIMALSAVVVNAESWKNGSITCYDWEEEYKTDIMYYEGISGFIGFTLDKEKDFRQLVIKTNNSWFEVKDYYAKVIIYDINNVVLETMLIDFKQTDIYERYEKRNVVKSSLISEGSKIVEYLNNNRGYVQIQMNRYSGGKFDMKVPCRKNSSTASAKRKTTKRNRK